MTKIRLTRKQQKAQTRLLLKRVALSCFGRGGVEKTTISMITESAGVAKGTFYVHFSDKDDLLSELLAEFNQRFVKLAAPIVQVAGKSPVERVVEALASVFLSHWKDNSDFIRAYAERAGLGLGTEHIKDGMNPQMLRVLQTLFASLTSRVGQLGKHSHIVPQALLSMWLRVGLQYVFSEDLERDIVIVLLRSMTVGALQSVFEFPAQ